MVSVQESGIGEVNERPSLSSDSPGPDFDIVGIPPHIMVKERVQERLSSPIIKIKATNKT